MNLRRFVRDMTAAGVLGVWGIVPTFYTAQAANLDPITQLMQMGKPKVALEALEPILKAEPKDAQANFLKGILLTEVDRIPEAIQIFNALAQDHPGLPEPHNNLAVLYAAQGRFDDARKSLDMAIHTNPSYAVAHENLGDLYAKLASMAYDQALQIDKTNPGVATKLQLLRNLFQPPKPAATVATNTTNTAKPTASDTSRTMAATPPAQPAASALQPTEAITAMLKDWAAAWSRKDVDAYLAFYDAGFDPSLGLTRNDWETQRRDRITRPSFIEVGVDRLKVTLSGEKTPDKTPDKARVRFLQSYKADHLKASDYKIMELVLRADGWKILREK